ncbi:MAG: hypothetical protein C4K48_12565 [Candidatus Thorarchaeota archaeon]|nr:MAG: hypothetical protein C4K48_12565 [Candidatus Thorarchaeota archaeon]
METIVDGSNSTIPLLVGSLLFLGIMCALYWLGSSRKAGLTRREARIMIFVFILVVLSTAVISVLWNLFHDSECQWLNLLYGGSVIFTTIFCYALICIATYYGVREKPAAESPQLDGTE